MGLKISINPQIKNTFCDIIFGRIFLLVFLFRPEAMSIRSSLRLGSGLSVFGGVKVFGLAEFGECSFTQPLMTIINFEQQMGLNK